MTAKQGGVNAAIVNFEGGAYKTWKAADSFLVSAIASLSHQSFDIEYQLSASFSANALKFLVEGGYFNIKMPLDLFMAMRGAYTISGDIEDSAADFEANNYYKAEILAGAKKDYRASDKIKITGKGLVGVPIIVSQERPSVRAGGDEFFGAKQNGFFGGLEIKGQYEIDKRFVLFADIKSEIGAEMMSYGLTFGLSFSPSVSYKETEILQSDPSKVSDKKAGVKVSADEKIDKKADTKETETLQNKTQGISNQKTAVKKTTAKKKTPRRKS